MPAPRSSRLAPFCAALAIWLGATLAIAADPAVGDDARRGVERWTLGTGETPASLARALFPADAIAQTQFVAALRAANPGLGERPPAGTEIVVPDLRRIPLGAGAEARSGAGAVLRIEPVEIERAAAGEGPLRLATRLATPTASDAERHLLRLEFRLIEATATQARNQGELIERLRLLERTEAALRAVVATPTSKAVDDGRPPIVMVASPAPAAGLVATADAAAPSRPDSPVAAAAGAATERQQTLAFAGGGLAAAILLLAAGAYLIRRRWIPRGSAAHHAAGATAGLPRADLPAPLAAGEVATLAPAGDGGESDGVAPSEDRSVVELAELMLGFGRVAGAAELLRRYIETSPGEALKPWVMLLDVYRRAGMEAEFTAAAARLKRHFNIQVEAWDTSANLSFVAHSLESYPHVIDRVTRDWRKPEGLRYLHHLLRDNRAGRRSGFAREVAEEIILLVEILESDPQLHDAAAPGTDNSSQRRA